MPRSYSFDHFTVPKSKGPIPERGHKRGKRAAGGGKHEVHYGKAHAETEEMYAVRMMDAQLEELAGTAAGAGRMSRASEEHDPLDRMRRGGPIGAMPTAELPGKFKIKDVWSDGMRHVRLLKDGTRDVISAAGFLWRMPRDMMRALLRRERHA